MISSLKVDQHITDLSSVIPTLQSHLGLVEAASREEVSAGLENYRYQHLSQIAPESRLLGKQGLKLKVTTGWINLITNVLLVIIITHCCYQFSIFFISIIIIIII